MHDADALESINVEQLVTATDRLLFRGGQLSKRRHVRRFAEGSQSHIAIARLAEGSQPRIPAAQFTDSPARTSSDAGLAWETTVPHPLSSARAVQPYRGHIVAAPFASVPHPKPQARYSQLDYDAVAPFAPRGLCAQIDFDFLDIPSIVSVVHPTPPVRGSHLAYLTAPSALARGSAPRMQPFHAFFQRRTGPAHSTRRSQQHEPTAVIRRDAGAGTQVFAMTVVIPALVGVAVGLAAQL